MGAAAADEGTPGEQLRLPAAADLETLTTSEHWSSGYPCAVCAPAHAEGPLGAFGREFCRSFVTGWCACRAPRGREPR